MNVDNLVHMANHIGEFFLAVPDREEALDGISQHIRKFWAPRMRIRLTDYWSKEGGTGLDPLVLEALQTHSILPTPVPVRTSDPAKAAEQHAFDGKTES
jgi:formate dehydrogenase subunit delta